MRARTFGQQSCHLLAKFEMTEAALRRRLWRIARARKSGADILWILLRRPRQASTRSQRALRSRMPLWLHPAAPQWSQWLYLTLPHVCGRALRQLRPWRLSSPTRRPAAAGARCRRPLRLFLQRSCKELKLPPLDPEQRKQARAATQTCGADLAWQILAGKEACREVSRDQV